MRQFRDDKTLTIRKIMQNFKNFFLILIFFIVFAVFGCADENLIQETSEIQPDVNDVVLEGDDVVLAVVNGSEITRYDVEYTVRSAFGETALEKLDQNTLKKVLESIVAGRAISQSIEKELMPQDLKALDKKLNAYREEILIQKYLAKYSTPQPVTMDMIRNYYITHPEEFGGKTIRLYEMITSNSRLDSQNRNSLLKIFENPSDKSDWKTWVENLNQKGFLVSYRKGNASEEPLNEKLMSLLNSLEKGDTSNVTYIDGVLYIARITDEQKIDPRPIKDVSAEIRKSLAPLQIKKAVKRASDQVLESAEVIYK